MADDWEMVTNSSESSDSWEMADFPGVNSPAQMDDGEEEAREWRVAEAARQRQAAEARRRAHDALNPLPAQDVLVVQGPVGSQKIKIEKTKGGKCFPTARALYAKRDQMRLMQRKTACKRNI